MAYYNQNKTSSFTNLSTSSTSISTSLKNDNSNISKTSSINIPGSNGEEFTLRVLTLNCWGVWLGAKKRRERMTGIVRYLRENNCDIVFLQEIWVTSDFEIIKSGTKDIYCFAHLFRASSVLGSSGIVILCKWYPKVIHFEPYSINGSPFYPWHGDWFAGKGIAYSRVDFDGLSLHLFSTHTHAYYKENESIHDQYSVHRVCQSYQLAKFINFISDTACNRNGGSGKDLLVVAGDMNSTSSELPYKILISMAGLTDCFKTSRYNNPSSNIIHKHKILNYMNKLYFADNASVSSCNSNEPKENSKTTGIGMAICAHAKMGETFLLDTLANYRTKITQVFFDSDTEDEDITYCHPKNSFTPSALNYAHKSKKLLSTSSSTTNSSNASTVETDKSTIKSSIKENGGDDEKNNKLDRVSSERNSTKQMLTKSSLQKSKKSPMKRIDFILCRLLTHGHCVVDRIATESKDPTINCSISDHEPVMVELKICDISHDLMKKNHLIGNSMDMSKKSDNQTIDQQLKSNKIKNNDNISNQINEQARPLSSIVESKVTINDASEIEETTNQWVPEEVPVRLSYHECNAQVMEETRDILMQYYQYNRSSKIQLFYIVLFMFIITLPTVTYYALANELIPISTVVFMWFAASFLFASCLLIGFLSYRFEQGAIEAILNDMKMSNKFSNHKYEINA